MTDGFDDRPPDDPPGGVGGEEDVDGKEDGSWEEDVGRSDGHDGPSYERAGGDPDGDGSGPGVDDEYEPSLAGVFGGRPEDEPPRKELVPETPSLENALFLLLGVLLGGFVVYRAVTVFTA